MRRTGFVAFLLMLASAVPGDLTETGRAATTSRSETSEHSPPQSFAVGLRELLQARGLGLRTLARMLVEASRPELTGDTRTDAIESRRRAVARWANGYNIPNERSTRAIAAALDVDPDTLLALRPARPRPERLLAAELLAARAEIEATRAELKAIHGEFEALQALRADELDALERRFAAHLAPVIRATIIDLLAEDRRESADF